MSFCRAVYILQTVLRKPQDVMEKFRPGVYDLVVLDIKMPIINGLQLYQEIRKVDKNVKVCFITASGEYYTGLIDN
jgi:DNA-binding LytR/AlgR family response regulator